MVVIALIVALLERFPGRRWIEPFAATGQLALTMYFAHVVLGLGLLWALGLIRGQSLAFSLACALVFCAVAVVSVTVLDTALAFPTLSTTFRAKEYSVSGWRPVTLRKSADPGLPGVQIPWARVAVAKSMVGPS